MKTAWFAALIAAICFEGLGRKYLPQIPALVFYFMKDAVLLAGYLLFRPGPAVKRTVLYLYRGFGVALGVAILWTVIELANPAHQSLLLGILGLRAYWLWWLAPVLIGAFLQDQREKRRAIFVLLIVSTAISVLAAIQFTSPPTADVNLYAVVDGQQVYAADAATVAATGRARVAGTFTFVSGFVDFCLLVPTLLLSLGLEAREPRVRRFALIATICSAAAIPMSGSRGSILLAIAVLLMMMWASGLFFTRIGRRLLVGAGVAAIIATVAFPDALFGVQSRFENRDETLGRVGEIGAVLPPVALAMYDYPLIGIGTGMQQNARFSLRVVPEWDSEAEVGRYLIELGPIGYLIVWISKLGLLVALLRAYRILKRAGRRGPAGAALAYAVLAMMGNLTFDHVWQALFFTGCGFIVGEVVAVMRTSAVPKTNPSPQAEPVALRPVA